MKTLKTAVILGFPLIFMVVFLLLRYTIGEANPIVYALMALPAPGWPMVFGLVGLVLLLLRGRRRWGVIYLVFAAGIIFPLLNPSFESPKVGRAKALRVMTFNVQKFHNFSPSQVAAAIKAENPDVVCLQEANFKAPPTPLPKEFRDLLKEYEVAQRGQTAILSKLPITFSNSFALRSGTDGRPAQLVSIMVQGRPVFLVCVHLQYFPWDGSISVSRASKNLMKETQSLEDLVKEPGVATIVAGDFNTLSHGRTHRMMRRYMKDSFSSTATGFGLTLPAVFPLKRLDYIYSGNGLVPLRSWVSTKVASDHRAVVADLAWNL